ncbi:copper resistance CopC family protein [Pedococcus sp.]|uniref:copper resistance CopC family protein n=1 Tax=Pedococcus sp. TaxID=2860345 RepID=UPI002E126ACD|nr:copper resistance CopC family protein [Pedococcus sp.]
MQHQHRLRRHAAWALLVTLVMGGALTVLGAGAAQAHATLLSISPSTGATLTSPPRAVVLTFSGPIEPTLTTVVVTDGNGRQVSVGAPTVAAGVVSERLRTDLVSGPYAVAFRIISTDGHPVADVSAFTLALRGRGGSGAAATPSSDQTTADPVAAARARAAAGTAADAAARTAADPATGRLRRLGLAVGVGTLAIAAGTAVIALARRQKPS